MWVEVCFVFGKGEIRMRISVKFFIVVNNNVRKNFWYE